MPETVIPQPFQDVVLVCITSTSQDAVILRTAQRHARALNIRWCAVYLELWEDQKESRAHSRNRVLEQVALAERMGATTFVIKAADYVRGAQEALAECSRRHYTPTLIVAGAAGPTASPATRRSVAALQQLCGDTLELMLISPSEQRRPRVSWFHRLHMRRVSAKSLVWALIATAAAAVLTQAIQGFIQPSAEYPYAHAFMIYLIATAVVAGRFGLMPGMITTVASFIAINLFTIAPLHSLLVSSFDDAVGLALFIAAGSVISLVNSQVHAEAEASEINEWRMQALLQVYKIALHAKTRNEALAELHENLDQFLSAEIAVYMPSLVAQAQLQLVWPEVPALNEQDVDILNRGWEELQAGHDVDLHNISTGWRFEPLTSANGELGMLALRVPHSESTDIHFERYLRMIAELVASILEKMESTDMKEESRVRDEREKLRTSLLSSVSHDLKTPLAAIIGSLSVYRSMYDKLPEAQRRELTDAALIEAQRLDSFITNILDLAKIESGAVKFKRQWQSPEDLVQRVKKRMRMRFENHTLVVHNDVSDIEVELDPVISEQALLNVLDNSIKYTPSGSIVEVRMETTENWFKLHVRDHGAGIPEEDRERIFDKYTRLKRQDHQVAGTGLGLAVARAAMRGQGGDITVEAHEKGGAIFTLCWPHWRVASTNSSGPHLIKTAI